MHIHHLQNVAVLFVVNRNGHISREFVVLFIGVERVLLAQGNTTGKVGSSSSARNGGNITRGARIRGRSTGHIGTRKLLGGLQIVTLCAIPTRVLEGHDPRTADTFGIDRGNVRRTGGGCGRGRGGRCYRRS